MTDLSISHLLVLQRPRAHAEKPKNAAGRVVMGYSNKHCNTWRVCLRYAMTKSSLIIAQERKVLSCTTVIRKIYVLRVVKPKL